MNVVSSRPGFYRHGYHLGARPGGFHDHNLGRGGYDRRAGGYHLGQFDPSSGITGDIMLGPEEPAPPESGIQSPYQTYGSPYPDLTPQNAPAPSVSVPSTGILSPYQTYGSIYNQPNTVSSSGTLPPGPSPRVNVPLAPSSVGMFLSNSSLITGVPNWIVLGGGLLAIPLLGSLVGGGGGRRRRR